MATKTHSKRRRSSRPTHLQKPKGVIHPRVEAVGPEHFGIVSVDCAKARSKWMLADFYGRVLVEPTVVEHAHGAFQEAIQTLHQAVKRHALTDVLVAVERTGNYHELPRRVFLQAGYEVRIVHPFATKQFRQPANPGNKTDDTDLAAIQRATVNGFGLLEPPLDENARRLRLLSRHRRDLVRKRALLCCQIREHIELAMPGYGRSFDDLWDSSIALVIAHWFPGAHALQQVGRDELTSFLRERRLVFQSTSVDKILAWAATASDGDPDAAWRVRIWSDLNEDRNAKTLQIQALERDIASALVQTPYVLLLAIPGIHVVSAAEFAAEMGPISHYANANAISGRAGLFPSRYQSDQVDQKNGPLVRCSNRKLRTAILQIADNLVKTNHYFAGHAALWRQKKVDERLIRVRVADRFRRIAYAMVAGRQLLNHPCCQKRHYILEKLQRFADEHAMPTAQLLADLNAAIDQLPRNAYSDEAIPLAEKLERIKAGRTRGPQRLGSILPSILARLLGRTVQSELPGDQASNESPGS
jgi:transposase